jgi:CelD/BcsL family acetyltransferase involved in cellulose biosynthesis
MNAVGHPVHADADPPEPDDGSGTQPIATRVDRSERAFEELRRHWMQLHEADPHASVFMSWEWQSAWWRHYGERQPLRIVTAWIGARLVGLAATYVQRASALPGFRARILRWVGTGADTSPDDLGPLLAPQSRGQVATALADAVLDLHADWDVLHLTDLDRSGCFWAAMCAAADTRRRRRTEEQSARIAYIDLPPTWDEYLASVHRDRRYAIRNTRRKLEAGTSIQFDVATRWRELEPLYERLVDLHTRRWSAKGVAHAFSTAEYIGFHRDAVKACAARDWVRFYALSENRDPIAMIYCYRFRRRVYYFQTGFDPAFERLRPGLVLIGHAVEHAIGQRDEAFDFLRGEHQYKTQWARGVRETAALRVYGRGLAARAFRLRAESFQALKGWLRNRAPWLLRLRQRMRAGGGDHA